MSFQADVVYALSRAGVSADESNVFCSWAFGNGWETAQVSEAGDRWNARHIELMKVEPTDSRSGTLLKMAELYKARKQ